MANYRSANVLVVDTTAAFAEALDVVGMKYVAGSGSPSVQIRGNADAGSGIIWEEDAATDQTNDLQIKDSRGLHITIAGTGTKLYLYLRV